MHAGAGAAGVAIMGYNLDLARRTERLAHSQNRRSASHRGIAVARSLLEQSVAGF